MSKYIKTIAIVTLLLLAILVYPRHREHIVSAQQSSTGTTFNPYVSGTTGSIGGGALLVGTPATGTASVPNVAAGRPCAATPSDGSSLTTIGAGLGVTVNCVVTSVGTATVYVGVTIAGTPTAKTYNVVAFP